MNEPRPLHHSADPHVTHIQPTPLRWLSTIAAILIIYLLSIGPAPWLETRVPYTGRFLSFLYFPIAAFCDLCPPAGMALLWYLGLIWRVPIDL
jgi:hypothetical protein